MKTVTIAALLLAFSINAEAAVEESVMKQLVPTGTLRVVGTNGHEVRHVINVMGRVRSCSPAPMVPGYRAC